MADDSSEEEASQSTLTLALDSNKQKEFEDKVKKLKAQVSTFFVLKGGKKPGLVLIVLIPLFNTSGKFHMVFVLFFQAEDLTPGVIYLGHIPHGFYENQIRDFFSQFGTVNKVRLSRCKKVNTNNDKKYCWNSFFKETLFFLEFSTSCVSLIE